jgi:putative DNA primase/helicase
VNRNLEFLLSDAMPGGLAPSHAADLRRSGLTDATIRTQRIRSVPPGMIAQLLGFDAPMVVSAFVIPFPDPRGGWMDHVRLKVFPTLTTPSGTIKYLQPRRSGVRIYFPLATLDTVLHSDEPLYLVEGEKKALAVAQTGLAAIGLCGIDGWHVRGARELHPDLDDIGLSGRVVNVIPDADVRTNPAVRAAVRRLGAALATRGAIARLVRVPDGYKGVDDWLVAESA